jgi:hypothetical protein
MSGRWREPERVTCGSKRLPNGALERTVQWLASRVGHGFSEARGEPTCVCGHVWVERLEPEITLLTDVSEAVANLVVITRGTLSPRASVHSGVAARGATSSRTLACARAVVALGPRTDEVASPSL